VHPELELVVDRCSEVQRWDFDPMLVELDACLVKPQAGLTSQAVSEVAQAVDLCLLGLDVCGSGQTSPRLSLLEPKQAGDPHPRSRSTSLPSRMVLAEAAQLLQLLMAERLTRRPQHRPRTS
jgi:hypothetical protein